MLKSYYELKEPVVGNHRAQLNSAIMQQLLYHLLNVVLFKRLELLSPLHLNLLQNPILLYFLLLLLSLLWQHCFSFVTL